MGFWDLRMNYYNHSKSNKESTHDHTDLEEELNKLRMN